MDASSTAEQRIEEALKTGAQKLDLGGCGLDALPKRLFELTDLEELDLSHWSREPDGRSQRKQGAPNRLTTLAGIERLQSLTYLDASRTLVSDLSPLAALTGLQSLYASRTQVSNLSPLAALTGLQNLDVSSTHVSDLSPLAALTGLQNLYASGTQVSDLSPLATLTGLQTLYVSSTPVSVSDLSPLAALSGLQNLYVSFTQVRDLNPLAALSALQTLDVSDTQVSDLRPLARLSRLERLDLDRTRVESLKPLRSMLERVGPIRFSKRHEGEWSVSVVDLKLTEPPMTVIEQGREAVLRYFDSLDASRGESIEDYVNREARLLVIGNSTAGKTHLIHYLKGPQARRAKLKQASDISSTHGMERHRWKPSKAIAKHLTADPDISILDFGGQEYYHDCHPLFFDSRTAYILVWEKDTDRHGRGLTKVRYESDEVEVELDHHPLVYWLESIAHFVRIRSADVWDLDQLVEGELGSVAHEPPASGSARDPSASPPLAACETSFATLAEALRRHPRVMALGAEQAEAVVDAIVQTVRCEIFADVSAIAVQNKVDKDGRVHLDMRSLTREFPFLVDSISVSVHEATRMPYLEGELLPEALGALGLVGETYPGHYRSVLERYANMDQFSVAIDVARKAFQDELPDSLAYDEKLFQEFLTTAAHLGKLLHFRYSGTLSEKVFCKPYELLARVHAILNRELGEEDGSFGLEHARTALQRRGFAPTEAEAVLELMQEFRIVFPLPQGSGAEPIYVAPQYLPEEPQRGIRFLRGMFDKALVRYRYAGFIHTSVILHFYSVFGARADTRADDPKRARDYLFWRDGIFVRSLTGDEVVLIEFERNSFSINLYPQSELRLTPLLAEIREQLEEISAGYSYTTEVSADGVTFVPLADLERRAERGVHWFEHDGVSLQLGHFAQFLPNRTFPMKKLFLSYSSRDRAFVDQLRAHLRVLERNNLISTWYDREIAPGMEWDRKIKRQLAESDVVVLMLSPDFLNSDYIWDVELEKALEMHEAKRATIVPVLLRSCLWADTPIARIQNANIVPKKAEPIDLAPNRDQAWHAVVEGIKRAIDPTASTPAP